MDGWILGEKIPDEGKVNGDPSGRLGDERTARTRAPAGEILFEV